jgi:hypothetical protein
MTNSLMTLIKSGLGGEKLVAPLIATVDMDKKFFVS